MSREFSAPPSASGHRGRIADCGPASIAAAAAALAAGDIVAIPTETVYGLAADATNGEAVARIYEAKGRPSFNPLIAHVDTLAAATAHGDIRGGALRLAEAFWPGPLTLVVPALAASPVSDLARAGLDSVALRVPAHPAARALLAAVGRPLAAPSANLSGRVSPTTAADVAAELGSRVAMILDGGPCPVGLESTIVGSLGGRLRLLRPGGVTREAIEQALGAPLDEAEAELSPRAPGMLASHYAPRAHVRLEAVDFAPDEAVLAFGPVPRPAAIPPERYLNVSPGGDLREAAARLFSALRTLDATGAARIAATPIPKIGLGEAINDRLQRAAAPRP
jgi:L-threonylcarbamoyladenylate synthase